MRCDEALKIQSGFGVHIHDTHCCEALEGKCFWCFQVTSLKLFAINQGVELGELDLASNHDCYVEPSKDVNATLIIDSATYHVEVEAYSVCAYF